MMPRSPRNGQPASVGHVSGNVLDAQTMGSQTTEIGV
jgi:hypothetical protein